jgi:DNA-binding transcriptional LysR family regulator
MMVFVRVVEAGSLSAAARNLHLSLAVASRKLARLEERLGVRLVNRTTRTLALTEEGTSFHARCVDILAEIEEAEADVTRGRDTASLPGRTAEKGCRAVWFETRTLMPLSLQEQSSCHQTAFDDSSARNAP